MVLLITLSGCTNNQVIRRAEYIFPPAAYLVPCERTEFTGNTYSETVEYLIKVMGERDLCAAQIERLREWRKQATK